MITDIAYSTTEVARLAKVTYRQLDYWDNTGLVMPSVEGAIGSGSARRYSPEDVIKIKAVATLLDAGLSLAAIRRVLRAPDPVEALLRLANKIETALAARAVA